MYRVKTIFEPTVQGVDLPAGMPCVILRLAGCTAWDGRPETRAASACPCCDTDFRGGESLDWPAIEARFAALLPGIEGRAARGYGCVLTGGEPLLQADSALFERLA